MNEVETNENVEVKLTRNKKYYMKCKANEYSCPECGKIINKAVASRHNKTNVHLFTIYHKAYINQNNGIKKNE